MSRATFIGVTGASENDSGRNLLMPAAVFATGGLLVVALSLVRFSDGLAAAAATRCGTLKQQLPAVIAVGGPQSASWSDHCG